MDKAGYKAYLQSLGNQKHYIGDIPELLELEQKYNINLDDYIPYNNNYSKVDALDDLLSDDVSLKEKIFFSINSYIRYRLSGFDKNKAVETKADNKSICCDYFTFNGTEKELKSKLLTFMSDTDSQSFINGFQDFIQFLGEDEFIKETTPSVESETDSELIHFLLKQLNYNINIKAITLITIALLLDIKLTLGFAATVLPVFGFNGHAIVRVDVSEGEKCLILEAMQSKNHIIDENVFSLCNSECIHNDLDCKYKVEDRCIMKKEDIKRVLDELCNKNIFKKIGKLYKYNF